MITFFPFHFFNNLGFGDCVRLMGSDLSSSNGVAVATPLVAVDDDGVLSMPVSPGPDDEEKSRFGLSNPNR